MQKQQSDNDQSRADAAAADEEMLEGPSGNKTCSVTQIKTKSMLIINSSQGTVEKGERHLGIVSCEIKKKLLLLSHSCVIISEDAFRAKLFQEESEKTSGWRGRVQIYSNKSFMPKK